MEYSISERLTHVNQLKDNGEFAKALQIINKLENEKELSFQEQIECYYLKGSLLFEQGYMDEAIKYVELAYKDCQQLKENLLTLDIILSKCNILRYSDRYNEGFDIIIEAEQILNKLDGISPIDFKERNAYLMYLKGYLYARKGDLNSSFRHGELGLQIAHEINNKRLIMLNAGILGYFFHWKGDFDTAQNYNEQRLKLAKEINDKQNIIGALNNIGTIFQEKGDFNQAMKYLKESLTYCEEINSFKTTAILDSLCRLAIEMDSFETAQECLESMKKFIDRRDKNLLGYNIYDLTKAIVLKKSPNDADKIRAIELFKKELEKNKITYEGKIVALLNLCELFLLELYQTNNIKILDDINLYIQQLLDIAKEQKSYWLLAETHLFQAKLKLVTFEFEKAQQLVAQAFHIAEKYGLDLLLTQIKTEKEELSKALNKWDNLKRSNANLSNRLDLANLNNQIRRMLKKRHKN
ncbi:MAG: tetratricopeptide repeat protein [Promethearchaeota archaeon]